MLLSDLRRLERVVCWEMNSQEKDTILIWAVRLRERRRDYSS